MSPLSHSVSLCWLFDIYTYTCFTAFVFNVISFFVLKLRMTSSWSLTLTQLRSAERPPPHLIIPPHSRGYPNNPMDIIAGFKDRTIAAVIDPTVAAFAPLLKAKKDYIREVPKKSFKYGETDRHQLDVFYPPTPPPTSTTKSLILFFIYGGGFNTGERSISPRTFGLVYACVGAFYARKGYIVIIPDYRLVPHVRFPGPAEDVRDAVRWATQNVEDLVSPGSPAPDADRIVLMGHSAGAAHIATLLFHPQVLPQDDALRTRIKAAVLESPPYDLSTMTMEWPTANVHATYWGTLEEAKKDDPLNLYRRLPIEAVEKLPKLLMVEGELEPDWLIDAGRVFRNEVKERTGQVPRKIVALGHNHISINWALSSGEGEQWAEETANWLEDVLN
ncbi:alpha/beta-hydrolase [Pholiota conissans]|uniref:Alpha/beta-hydrolase n=1 Tax=Pholiota conissans TaxID=109636 RepID=A0A9P6D537_9AGAR|nr:alpha/beta-hydrolase [Pholiota conissans]